VCSRLPASLRCDEMIVQRRETTTFRLIWNWLELRTYLGEETRHIYRSGPHPLHYRLHTLHAQLPIPSPLPHYRARTAHPQKLVFHHSSRRERYRDEPDGISQAISGRAERKGESGIPTAEGGMGAGTSGQGSHLVSFVCMS